MDIYICGNNVHIGLLIHATKKRPNLRKNSRQWAWQRRWSWCEDFYEACGAGWQEQTLHAADHHKNGYGLCQVQQNWSWVRVLLGKNMLTTSKKGNAAPVSCNLPAFNDLLHSVMCQSRAPMMRSRRMKTCINTSTIKYANRFWWYVCRCLMHWCIVILLSWSLTYNII